MKKRFLLAALIPLLFSCNANNNSASLCTSIEKPESIDAELYHEESIQFKEEYLPEDFPKVKCMNIDILNRPNTEEGRENARKNPKYGYFLRFYLIEKTRKSAREAAAVLEKDFRVWHVFLEDALTSCSTGPRDGH